jgi:hypothetical protein
MPIEMGKKLYQVNLVDFLRLEGRVAWAAGILSAAKKLGTVWYVNLPVSDPAKSLDGYGFMGVSVVTISTSIFDSDTGVVDLSISYS